ncbi:MAG: hypothetical protein IT437_04535 [Phycisphaerales bacterium]|nr:hypothetical protein [Phycisphaerales bacterium]
MIIGHLPVLASAWAMQYARDCAERLGGWVGVIKARAGQVAVELVGAVGERAPAPSAASAEEGVRVAMPVVRLWLLRVEGGSESRVLDLAGVDRAVLLCGADEAAVVASYQTLKDLHEAGGTGRVRSVGLAVMGSPAGQATMAAQRLSRAVEAFLGHGLPMTACVPQINAGRVVTVFRGSSAGAPEAVLADLLRHITAAPPGGSATPVASPAFVREPAGGVPAAVPTAATPEMPTTPMIHAAPDSVPALAGLLPGLVALRARCPFEPGIELAADGQGGLHLLAQGAPREAAASLASAAGWAGEHLEILRLTPGGQGLTGSLPVKHLLTREPKAARRALDTDLRVHGLACAGGAWVALDLN